MKWRLPLIHRGRKAKPKITRPPHEESKPKKLSFDDLPYEIRAMILELCDLYWCWEDCRRPGSHNNHLGLNRRSMPNIIALRPQPIVYYQALSLFYKQNTYHLDEENCHSFGWKMWPWAIRSIRRLEINIVESRFIAGSYTKAGEPSGVPFEPEWVMAQLQGNHAIEHLRLYLGPCKYNPYYELSRSKTQAFIDDFPRWLRCFKRLKSLAVQIPVDTSIVQDWADASRKWPTCARKNYQRVHEARGRKVRRFDAVVGGIGRPFGGDLHSSPWQYPRYEEFDTTAVENWIWTPVKVGGWVDWSKVPVEALEITKPLEPST